MSDVEMAVLNKVKQQLETMLFNLGQFNTAKMDRIELENTLKYTVNGVKSVKEFIERNQK